MPRPHSRCSLPWQRALRAARGIEGRRDVSDHLVPGRAAGGFLHLAGLRRGRHHRIVAIETRGAAEAPRSGGICDLLAVLAEGRLRVAHPASRRARDSSPPSSCASDSAHHRRVKSSGVSRSSQTRRGATTSTLRSTPPIAGSRPRLPRPRPSVASSGHRGASKAERRTRG